MNFSFFVVDKKIGKKKNESITLTLYRVVWAKHKYVSKFSSFNAKHFIRLVFKSRISLLILNQNLVIITNL